MARAQLLAFSQDPHERSMFEFEHAMNHRNAMGVSAPLTRFSAVPYFIQPMIPQLPEDAVHWNLNHQQAHNDAASVLPGLEDSPVSPVAMGGNLIDTDLNDQVERTWWTFHNHQIHHDGSQAIIPATGKGWTYPFW